MRKVRNVRAWVFTNPDNEYEEAPVFNKVTAIGYNQWNFHVKRSVFAIQNVFQTLLINLDLDWRPFTVHVCSVHIQASFLVERMLYFGKIYSFVPNEGHLTEGRYMKQFYVIC